MATWQLTAQLTTGTLVIDPSFHLWWNGTNYGDNITVNQYQDSTHVADSNDVQQDTLHFVHNTKYIDSTHVSIDGAGSTALPISTTSCGLLFTFSDPSSVTTSAGLLYAYDGVDDANPISNLNFQVAEGGVSTQWSAANGLNAALVLQDQTASTTHNFYIAASLSPKTSGLKSGKIKIVLNYV